MMRAAGEKTFLWDAARRQSTNEPNIRKINSTKNWSITQLHARSAVTCENRMAEQQCHE